jgi:regulator of nucleoside diphosphate kinase
MENQMTKQSGSVAATRRLKPRITLTVRDHEKLSSLARAAAGTMPDIAAALTEELDRAHVAASGRHPDNIVCMGCEVEFRDDLTGKTQTVTLVYPEEADISKGRISVLTPIGTALIGLRAGGAITWETRSGEVRRLTVLHVRAPQLA